MAESRDPAIKLFGKTIPFPASDDDRRTEVEDKGRSDKAAIHETNDKDHDSRDLETKSEPPQFSSAKEILGTSADQETTPMKNLEPEEQKSGTSISQEKMIKKPDKILPCPRCSSLDTKFCYYNNYNVNQPRHFCKHCQRYWTAGGTMRNVPVGAGRRKNKNLASQLCHISVSKANFQTVRPEVPDTIHLPTLKPNGTVLSFGSDTPLCESIASVFNCAEKKMKNCNQNEFHRPEEQVAPFHAVEIGDEQSGGSSVTTSTGDGIAANQQEPVIQNCKGFPAQFPYINGSSPWPYPWSPVPAFCPSNYPLSFYPAPAYWGCAVPSTWTIPWISPPNSSSNGFSGAGSNSQTLGKHSREEEVLNNFDSENGDSPKLRNQERWLWIPKTLRIHDPKEAVKSSIWETMGFKYASAYGLGGEGLFKAVQKKEGLKNHTEETSQVLHANPAALSLFLNFQEIS